MIDLWVNVAGVALVGLIVWWFWLSKPKSVRIEKGRAIDISVANGVYTPARIEVPVRQAVILRFHRDDPSPCAEKVVFEDMNIVEELPLGKPKEVQLYPEQTGEFPFTCQMKMYRGTLVVK